MKDRFVIIRHPEVCLRWFSQISLKWEKSEELGRDGKVVRAAEEGRGVGKRFTAAPFHVND
jgi:hypothetical protein